MQHQHIDETQIMEQNLHRLIKNQNYFSCFIQNSKHQQQPTNPFQKKLFDKNLRRSAISCGHYASNHNTSNLDQSHRLSSSRRKSLLPNNQNQNNLQQSNIYAQIISQPIMKTAHKVSLAQSRHSGPTKQQITQIINNFRLQLDYLEEKLHHKVDQLNCRYGDRQCDQKNREAQFMVDSLEKIVGFMVENCVNLEDSVMYGDKTEEDTGRNSEIMRKQVYQIDEEQNEENMSFSNQNTADQFKPTHKFPGNNENSRLKMSGKRRKIVGMIEKQNVNSNNQEEQSMPQTYYINSKLHTNSDNVKVLKQNQTVRSANDHTSKTTKRAPSKSSSKKPINTTVLNAQTNAQTEQYHYHSSKQTSSSQNQHNSTSSHHESNHGAKSIYETVLEQRELRLKMKKKIV